MGFAVGLIGRRLGIGLIVCIGHLAGPMVHADPSGWDRFMSKFSGKKLSSDKQTQIPASDQIPDIGLDLEENFQPDDAESMIRYFASQRFLQQASLADGSFKLDYFMQSALNGSFQLINTLSPFDANMATSFEVDATLYGPRWTYVHADRVDISALASSYWMSQTNGINTVSHGKPTVLAAADIQRPMAGLSLGWNLTTNLQFTLNGDYLSIYYEDSDGSIINLWAGLRYNLLDSVSIGIGYDMLEVDVESADLSFSGLIDEDRQWGPKAFLSMRF
ncbi:MAG: hypothetical protein QGH93_03595 [Gammaproteobacteria bacterium]|nr:hypothetical protein [Gammaproteobacteria bacterium]